MTDTTLVPDNTFVRVSSKETGTHFTTTRRELDSNSDLTELKQDAVDGNGTPLPPKFKENLPAGPSDEQTSTKTGPKETQK